MTTTHACPGGCGAQVPYRLYACKPCWSRLPAALRQPILDTNGRAGNLAAHGAAMADARDWYRAQVAP